MSSPRPAFMLAVAGACLFAGTFQASAQYRLRQYEEPQWARLRFDRLYTGIYTEAYTQTTSVDGGADSKQTRIFVGPLLGFDLSGSIYHPNLVTYHLNVDGSVGWTDDEFSGSQSSSQEEIRFLGSFLGEANFLSGKAFNGRLFANYTHSYQDYDFFNRLYVDTLRYGGSVGWTEGRFSFLATLTQQTEDAQGNPIPVWSESTIGTASLTHQRNSGASTLTGAINNYTRTDYGVAADGLDYGLNFSDAEDFGARKHWHSVVNFGYNKVDSLSVPTDLYSASANLRADHTDDLSSQYVVNYTRNTFAETENDNLTGFARLEHRLFDSLVTDLDLQGYTYSASSRADEQTSWQLGGGPGFRYTKQLSSSSTLTAYENIAYYHTDVQSTGGLIPVIDEQYFFSAASGGDRVTLRQPNVISSSILITDTARLPPAGFIPGIDYVVIQNGQFTIIERPTGSRMPNAVLINYNFVASPSGNYDTLNNAAGFRLDFFDNHWSVYLRHTLSQNNGAENLVVQDLNILVIGTEGRWKALRAGVEFERYDSSLSPYNAFRLYQSATFTPEESSTLSLNLTEAFYNYLEAGRNDQNYTATARYHWAVTRRLGVSIEAGVSQRFGDGVEQTLAVFRPQLQYTAGKFSASVGYDLNYDEFLNTQTRIRNLGFVRLRKDF